MNRSKIEWCDYTFNLITGCFHGCDYCYARQMTRRFSGEARRNISRKGEYKTVTLPGGKTGYILEKPMANDDGVDIPYPFDFEPTLHLHRRERLDNLKGTHKVFVGSMADVFGEWVPEEWIMEVFSVCEEHPLNNYLFLTKNPTRYLELSEKGLLPQGENYWYGSTITDEETEFFVSSKHNTFISIEPILKPFKTIPQLGEFDGIRSIDWVIVGAETGNRKGKVIPELSWIQNIAQRADIAGVPVFMKDSLIPIVGEKNMRREYPEKLLARKMSPKMEKKLFNICNRCKKKNRINRMVRLQAQTLRGSTSRTYGYMCWECFEKHCESLGVDIPNIPNPLTGKETE